MKFRFRLCFYFLFFLIAIESGWAVVATVLRKTHRIAQISINDISVTEGGNLVFTVSSPVRPSGNAVFDWATSDGSAIGGTHYATASGQGTIAAGTLTTTVTVATSAVGTACGPDRTMTVTLSNPVNANIIDNSAIGTIRGRVPTISINNLSGVEGNSFDFVITLSELCSEDVAFNYSTVSGTAQAGADFNSTSGLALINSGFIDTTISVSTLNDSLREVSEDFFLSIYNVVQADTAIQSFGRGTVNDNEVGAAIIKVASSQQFACALNESGVVKCWGRELNGRLGQGGAHLGDDASDVGDNLPYVNLGTGVIATKIARGKHHVCVITTTDQVKCWGRGNVLGLESTEDRGDNLGEMGDDLPYVNVGTGHTVRDIAVNSSSTCVILDDYRVKCWGEYSYLGLGLSSTSIVKGDASGEMGDSLGYVDLGTGLTARKIAAVGNAACVIIEDVADIHDGKVKCWGDNVSGRLGLGDTSTRGDASGEMGDNLPFVDLGTNLRAAEIFGGDAKACVVLDDLMNTNDGKVKCWGSNTYGTLGLGDTSSRGDGPGEMGDSLPIINLGTGYTVTDIGIGYSNVCFVLGDGSLKCLGWNGYSGLGTGGVCSGNCGDSLAEMGDALLPLSFGGNIVTNVAYSASHGCAILGTAQVACWGQAQGQGDFGVNILTTSSQWGTPADLGTGVNAFALAKGSSNDAGAGTQTPECAIMTDGRVKCWGGNFYGRLGSAFEVRGDQANEMGANLTTVALGTGRTARDITVGDSHACALLDNYQIKCWGNYAMAGTDTRKGDQPNEMGDNLVEINLGTGRSAVAVVANGGTTCAITDLYDVKCWGLGSWATHGHGNSTTWGDSPAELGDNLPVTNLGMGRKAIQLSAGGSMCAILDNMKVKCWGDNSHGGLGLGNTTNRGAGAADMGDNLPYVDMGTVSVPVQLVGGADHNCALYANGNVKCWGDGSLGQMGTGNTSDWSNTISEVGDSIPFIDLGTGRTVKGLFSGSQAFSNCAILDDNSLKCWGSNTFGGLGLGDTSNRGDSASEMGDNLPTVSLGTGLVPSQVSVGSNSTCAVMTNGTLKCWGQNKYGQLGLGDYTDRGDDPGEMGDNLSAVDAGF